MPDLTIIKQDGFAGGVNLVDDPHTLAPNEFSDCSNLVLIGNHIEQKNGFTQYNSTTIGAAVEIRAIHQFKNCQGTYYPVCQTSDDKIYVGSAAFPSTGSWTSIKTQTASSNPACFTDVGGKLVMTNGVDVPQVYEGTYGKCEGALVYIPSTYYDYLNEASDESTATHVPLDGMLTTTLFYIGAKVAKVKGYRIVMGSNVNAAVQTQVTKYWNGYEWAATAGWADGTLDTATSTKTLNKSGNVTFTEVTIAPVTINNQHRYWLQVTVTGTLSATVDVTGIYIMYDMQALPTIWDGVEKKCTDCRKTVDVGSTYTDYTTNVSDGSTTTGADLSSLDTQANGDWWIVKYSSPFMGVHFTLGTDVNGNDADLATAVRAAGAWAAMTCSDGTQDGAHTIGKTGYVYWAIPAAWDKSDTTGSGTPGYEVRFSVSAALDAAVLLAEVEIIPQPPALGVYDLCLGTINRLMLASLPDAKNEIDISADGNINDYIGSDADYQLIPVGNYITSLKVFYNEVFVGTQSACYLLEGHSPDSFGLLHVNTGETGPVNNACVVTWEKRLFYIHNTGVYMFDGTGTECVSKKIDNYFDPIDIARYIPTTRLSKIQGRFNSLRNCVEWTVSKGSTQTTNNHILVYYSQQDVDGNEMGAWFLHDYAASSLVTIQGLGLELYYHGGYVGKIYQDDTTFQDNSVDITSSLTTRGFSLDPTLGLLGMFRGIHLLVDSQTSGTLTITKSADGTTSFSSLGTVSMINTDKDHSWVEYLEPILGVSCQFKIVNTTTNIPMIIHSLYAVATPVREGFIV